MAALLFLLVLLGTQLGCAESYFDLAADGITEVIEHRSYSTVFYIVDDPAVKRAIGAP